MGRPKLYDRDRVLEQVMDLFWRKGFRATSLADITVATGLNKKSLYAEFGDKNALFSIALQLYLESRYKLAGHILLHQPLSQSNIRDFFSLMNQHLDYRGCLLTLSLNERESICDEHFVMVQESIEAMESLFRENLKAEISVDSLEKLSSRAKALSTLAQGLTTMAKSGNDQNELQQITDLILNGILTNSSYSE